MCTVEEGAGGGLVSKRVQKTTPLMNFQKNGNTNYNKTQKKFLSPWIHNKNLLKKGIRIEAAIRIFKVWIRTSEFASPPAWIHKALGFANPYF